MEQFGALTPSMFQALRKRQEVAYRHEWFGHAMVAADYRNAHRTETSDRMYTPFDYVRPEGEELEQAVQKPEQSVEEHEAVALTEEEHNKVAMGNFLSHWGN
jgi:hypothetical protein